MTRNLRRATALLATTAVALTLAACALGVLAGCGSTPERGATAPTAPTAASAASAAASAPPSARSAAPQRVTLASEQLRLSELFRGTPVVFAMQSDGGLRVAVPLRYCFEPGSTAIKPPLAAVLDRLAKSQLNELTRLRVAAAGDAGAAAPAAALARSRAQGMIDYLAAHGIKPSRSTVYAATRVEGVEIVVAESAPH